MWNAASREGRGQASPGMHSVGVGFCFSSSPSPRLSTVWFFVVSRLGGLDRGGRRDGAGHASLSVFPACMPQSPRHHPLATPHHIPSDQRHIWTLPLLSFPVPVIHCPVPHLGAKLCPSMRSCRCLVPAGFGHIQHPLSLPQSPGGCSAPS